MEKSTQTRAHEEETIRIVLKRKLNSDAKFFTTLTNSEGDETQLSIETKREKAGRLIARDEIEINGHKVTRATVFKVPEKIYYYVTEYRERSDGVVATLTSKDEEIQVLLQVGSDRKPLNQGWCLVVDEASKTAEWAIV